MGLAVVGRGRHGELRNRISDAGLQLWHMVSRCFLSQYGTMLESEKALMNNQGMKSYGGDRDKYEV